MFVIAWVIRVVYYIIDVVFASVFQTMYDRLTGNSSERNRPETRSPPNQIHISTPRSPIVYVMGMFIIFVLIDRFSVFAGHYSERGDEEQWAIDTLDRMCDDDTRYKGRIYADNCMRAHKIANSGRIGSSLRKTIRDTHLCIWWDCTTLTYNAVTSMSSLTIIAVVLIIVTLMCGGGLGGGGLPQTITLVPATHHVATPNTSNSQKTE